MKKIYLAIPYTGREEEAFLIVNNVAGKLMNQGHIVFSPISHSHPIAQCCNMPKDWEFWQEFDKYFIEWCDEVWVCYPVNWSSDFCLNSVGVKSEMMMANGLKKSICFISDQL